MKISTALKILIPLAILIGLIALSPQLKKWLDKQHSGIVHTYYSDCDLTKTSCQITNNSSEFLITLSNDSASQRLATNLTKGVAPSAVKLIIEGKDMFMGVTTRPLNKTPENNFMVQDVIVPACTVDARMIWLYKIQFTIKDVIYEHVFEIDNSFHEHLNKSASN